MRRDGLDAALSLQIPYLDEPVQARGHQEIRLTVSERNEMKIRDSSLVAEQAKQARFGDDIPQHDRPVARSGRQSGSVLRVKGQGANRGSGVAVQQERLSRDKVVVLVVLQERLHQPTPRSRVELLPVHVKDTNGSVDPSRGDLAGVVVAVAVVIIVVIIVVVAGGHLHADDLVAVQGLSRSHAAAEQFALRNLDGGIGGAQVVSHAVTARGGQQDRGLPGSGRKGQDGVRLRRLGGRRRGNQAERVGALVSEVGVLHPAGGFVL
mmetsp:Transcript_14969/g.34578  ORF Transcript_14969/g.34578 Transcript_14969/m.34578 type:complete len:265 (-) Transcript_14969:179-973(-)